MKITFSPPYIDDDVISSVEESLRSGWITTGPKVKKLEEELERRLGVDACICVNSWTSGATLALRWLGVKEGDEVIVPAYTYCATAMAVIDAGAKPVMVDINDEMTLDVEKMKQAITSKTKAIIPVDLGGQPCA
ncbi:MAG: aminotransferase class I/II-fold pyridoxal phosphate-dependent enzyme, partial [Bacteroidales bacterium]|nr:aminotransferase class I/II-fold pyridoxal phosphate-dependent enzyme [Bacteroidales bacterium]